MKWNYYPKLTGSHAFLSPSKHYWVNYDEDKFRETYSRQLASERGTELHELAAQLIKLGVKLPTSKRTLNMFVNDAIGFRMSPEVTLFFSENCYGTADTISFNQKTSLLRIHDLKTGIMKTSMRQLEVYTSLFCLEYRKDPNEIECELRLYQNNDIIVHIPSVEDILYIMNKIQTFDKWIREMNDMKG